MKICVSIDKKDTTSRGRRPQDPQPGNALDPTRDPAL